MQYLTNADQIIALVDVSKMHFLFSKDLSFAAAKNHSRSHTIDLVTNELLIELYFILF